MYLCVDTVNKHTETLNSERKHTLCAVVKMLLLHQTNICGVVAHSYTAVKSVLEI